MRSHRLDRLALLTRGIALIGFGLADVACGKDGAPANEPPHVNAPPEPVTAAPSAASSSANPPVPDLPTAPQQINSPPAQPSASSSATPSASSSASPGPKASASTNITATPAPKPKPPPHINAPKK